MSTRRLIGRRCLRCSRIVHGRSYCVEHAAEERAIRQPYAAAYQSREYRRARRTRFELAGGRCESVGCGQPASEAHHLIPLSRARSYAEAVALCTVENLRAVCFSHNPRGG